MTETYFRKGFGLKNVIEERLVADYHSAVVEALKLRDYALQVGPLEIRLAREFGFCYGVDRAVDYAYEARTKFPDRRLFLVGEIIHNPHVNRKLEDMQISFLTRDGEGTFDFSVVTADDVVIMPAFGVTVQDFERLRQIGCVMVDTTCGSVLNVWKRVERYAREGFTAIIHGKHFHEETKATASQVTKYPGGRYLVVRNMEEARLVCDFIERVSDPAPLMTRFVPQAVPAGFDFSSDLKRVGLANQTTMLSGESLAIAEEFRKSMERRYGADTLEEHYRTFDTICSATQERQDAVEALLQDPPDLMVVVGGYNSSNTCHLASMCMSRGVRTYHIEDSSCIDPAARTVVHQPVGGHGLKTDSDFMSGVSVLGLTAGASTPNNKIGQTVARLCEAVGLVPELDAVVAAA